MQRQTRSGEWPIPRPSSSGVHILPRWVLPHCKPCFRFPWRVHSRAASHTRIRRNSRLGGDAHNPRVRNVPRSRMPVPYASRFRHIPFFHRMRACLHRRASAFSRRPHSARLSGGSGNARPALRAARRVPAAGASWRFAQAGASGLPAPDASGGPVPGVSPVRRRASAYSAHHPAAADGGAAPQFFAAGMLPYRKYVRVPACSYAEAVFFHNCDMLFPVLRSCSFLPLIVFPLRAALRSLRGDSFPILLHPAGSASS